MVDVRIGVLRDFRTEQGHQERARLLHGMADLLDVPVYDWGQTDDATPHEYVEIIAALTSAPVLAAVVALGKAWISRQKITSVTIQINNGATINVENATASDLERILRALPDT